MSSPFPNFEPFAKWANPDGTLTDRAKGFLRNILDFIGAREGELPLGSLGADGTTEARFLSEAGFRVPDYPEAADPSASSGLTAQNGTAETFMRSDAAPAIDLGITPTWTGAHIFSAGVQTTTLAASGACTFAAFGCNGATAQTSATVGAAVVGTAATNSAPYGYSTQAQADDIVSRINQIRAALVANGICV